MRLWPDHGHSFAEAVASDEFSRLGELFMAPWPAGAADDNEVGPPAAPGSPGSAGPPREEGESFHRDHEALQRLDASYEKYDRDVRGKTDGPPSLCLVTGAEEGMVDSGSDDLDPGRVGPVQSDKLGRLDAARGQDRVRATHGGRLACGPSGSDPRLVFAHLRLHAVQGVESRDEGQVEKMLQRVAGQGGEPVVGVEYVNAITLP